MVEITKQAYPWMSFDALHNNSFVVANSYIIKIIPATVINTIMSQILYFAHFSDATEMVTTVITVRAKNRITKSMSEPPHFLNSICRGPLEVYQLIIFALQYSTVSAAAEQRSWQKQDRS